MKRRMSCLIDLQGLFSGANETQLDSCIRQSVNEDISMPSVTSFISFSFFIPSQVMEQSSSASLFFSFLYLFISFPSYLDSTAT